MNGMRTKRELLPSERSDISTMTSNDSIQKPNC